MPQYIIIGEQTLNCILCKYSISIKQTTIADMGEWVQNRLEQFDYLCLCANKYGFETDSESSCINFEMDNK